MGAYYVGGYIRVVHSKEDWLKKRTHKWEKQMFWTLKQRGNTLKKVMPWWTVRSNRNRYFSTRDKIYCRGIQGIVKGSVDIFLPRLFFGISKDPPSSCRSNKSVAGKERRAGTKETWDIIII